MSARSRSLKILWITLQMIIALISPDLERASAHLHPYISEFQYAARYHPSRNPDCAQRRREPREGRPADHRLPPTLDDEPLVERDRPRIEIRAVLIRRSKAREEVGETSRRRRARKCAREVLVSVKIHNIAKTNTREEFLLVDHALDPVKRRKVRLRNPYAIKVRQEPLLHLYGLKFQSVVNAEATEEVIDNRRANFTGCNDDTDEPTCGRRASIDGEPTLLSRGFCCSCEPRADGGSSRSAAVESSHQRDRANDAARNRSEPTAGSFDSAEAPRQVERGNGEDGVVANGGAQRITSRNTSAVNGPPVGERASSRGGRAEQPHGSDSAGRQSPRSRTENASRTESPISVKWNNCSVAPAARGSSDLANDVLALLEKIVVSAERPSTMRDDEEHFRRGLGALGNVSHGAAVAREDARAIATQRNDASERTRQNAAASTRPSIVPALTRSRDPAASVESFTLRHRSTALSWRSPAGSAANSRESRNSRGARSSPERAPKYAILQKRNRYVDKIGGKSRKRVKEKLRVDLGRFSSSRGWRRKRASSDAKRGGGGGGLANGFEKREERRRPRERRRDREIEDAAGDWSEEEAGDSGRKRGSESSRRETRISADYEARPDVAYSAREAPEDERRRTGVAGRKREILASDRSHGKVRPGESDGAYLGDVEDAGGAESSVDKRIRDKFVRISNTLKEDFAGDGGARGAPANFEVAARSAIAGAVIPETPAERASDSFSPGKDEPSDAMARDENPRSIDAPGIDRPRIAIVRHATMRFDDPVTIPTPGNIVDPSPSSSIASEPEYHVPQRRINPDESANPIRVNDPTIRRTTSGGASRGGRLVDYLEVIGTSPRSDGRARSLAEATALVGAAPNARSLGLNNNSRMIAGHSASLPLLRGSGYRSIIRPRGAPSSDEDGNGSHYAGNPPRESSVKGREIAEPVDRVARQYASYTPIMPSVSTFGEITEAETLLAKETTRADTTTTAITATTRITDVIFRRTIRPLGYATMPPSGEMHDEVSLDESTPAEETRATTIDRRSSVFTRRKNRVDTITSGEDTRETLDEDSNEEQRSATGRARTSPRSTDSAEEAEDHPWSRATEVQQVIAVETNKKDESRVKHLQDASSRTISVSHLEDAAVRTRDGRSDSVLDGRGHSRRPRRKMYDTVREIIDKIEERKSSLNEAGSEVPVDRSPRSGGRRLLSSEESDRDEDADDDEEDDESELRGGASDEEAVAASDDSSDTRLDRDRRRSMAGTDRSDGDYIVRNVIFSFSDNRTPQAPFEKQEDLVVENAIADDVPARGESLDDPENALRGIETLAKLDAKDKNVRTAADRLATERAAFRADSLSSTAAPRAEGSVRISLSGRIHVNGHFNRTPLIVSFDAVPEAPSTTVCVDGSSIATATAKIVAHPLADINADSASFEPSFFSGLDSSNARSSGLQEPAEETDARGIAIESRDKFFNFARGSAKGQRRRLASGSSRVEKRLGEDDASSGTAKQVFLTDYSRPSVASGVGLEIDKLDSRPFASPVHSPDTLGFVLVDNVDNAVNQNATEEGGYRCPIGAPDRSMPYNETDWTPGGCPEDSRNATSGGCHRMPTTVLRLEPVEPAPRELLIANDRRDGSNDLSATVPKIDETTAMERDASGVRISSFVKSLPDDGAPAIATDAYSTNETLAPEAPRRCECAPTDAIRARNMMAIAEFMMKLLRIVTEDEELPRARCGETTASVKGTLVDSRSGKLRNESDAEEGRASARTTTAAPRQALFRRAGIGRLRDDSLKIEGRAVEDDLAERIGRVAARRVNERASALKEKRDAGVRRDFRKDKRVFRKRQRISEGETTREDRRRPKTRTRAKTRSRKKEKEKKETKKKTKTRERRTSGTSGIRNQWRSGRRLLTTSLELEPAYDADETGVARPHAEDLPRRARERREGGTAEGSRSDRGSERARRTRGGQDCTARGHPANIDAAEYLESAHCLRFSDLWYSVYQLEHPLVEHTVYLQIYEKRASANGSSHWEDLTEGSAVRLGTFHERYRTSRGTITFTYEEAKTPGREEAANLDVVGDRLLVPSSVTSSGALRPNEGEYLMVPASSVNENGSECDKAGVGFAAFVGQPDRCGRVRGSCLKNQPLAYRRHDADARAAGRPGCYFLSNFASVPSEPIRCSANGSGSREFLALEYHSPHVSAIDIEIRPSYNAALAGGFPGRISRVYVDGTAPDHTVVTIVISNRGTSTMFCRARIARCPAGLPGSWVNATFPRKTIQSRRNRTASLNLHGELPIDEFHCTVQLLNRLGEPVASKRIKIRKMERCYCASHCACACDTRGTLCRPVPPVLYRAAGFRGSVLTAFPEHGIPSDAILDALIPVVALMSLLLFVGSQKWLIGLYVPAVGRWGLDSLLETSGMLEYFERELKCKRVVRDERGAPVHPETRKRTVRICGRKAEFFLNTTFFFVFPLAACCHRLEKSLLPDRRRRCCSDRSKIDSTSGRSDRSRMIRVSTYSDRRDSKMETDDTRYVMDELKKSEESLRGHSRSKRGNRYAKEYRSRH